ncbi:MAG TPA: hypothetical protein VG013_06510 [Gemmataceae bacterium]|jgi:hypothetical protein|nr:hypothetical protein [Gemmataceae bacterium]
MSTAVYPVLASGLIDTITHVMLAGRVEESSAEAVGEAAALCRQARRAVKAIRDEQEQTLGDGRQAREFVDQMDPLAQMLGRGLAILSRLVDDLGDRDLTPPMTEFLSEAQALVREAGDLHGLLAEALVKAKAPPHPIDWDRARDAEAAFTRGETKPFQRHPKAGAKE